MNVLSGFINLAGIYRDLLTHYQTQIAEEIKKDKDFVIPAPEFETYCLLHDISMSSILLIDKCQLFDRKAESYERFNFSDPVESPDSEDSHPF